MRQKHPKRQKMYQKFLKEVKMLGKHQKKLFLAPNCHSKVLMVEENS